MHKVTNIPVVLINPLLTCKLCGGYLIDATTIVECLHSFCRSCILGYLKLHTTCPICDTLLHKTRPHYAIRPDRALQAMVYKLIPDLFEKEMECRRQFYKDHPCPEARSLSPEKRGDITMNTYVIQEEEHISIELSYWQPDTTGPTPELNRTDGTSPLDYRSTYLLCPPDLTVGHLEKLIRMKFELKPGEHEVALFFSSDDLFSFDYTLSDLACLYSWRSHQPMKVYFTIMERNQSVSSKEKSQPHSTKSATRAISDHSNQSFQTPTTCAASCESRCTMITANTLQSSKVCSDSCAFPNPNSRSPHLTRSDLTHRPSSRFKDNYFSDASAWDAPQHCSYADSSFSKPSQRSIEPAVRSPAVPSINNTTSVCSPRA